MQNKNLKLKLGLCGLALTSFLAVNAHSVVHADTVSDSNANNNAITWNSDSDDSQVVKEEPQQGKVSQSVQKQAKQSTVQASQSQPAQNKKVMVSDVSSTSVSQKRAETSTVRSSSADRLSATNKSATSVQNSRANLISNVDSASSTAIDDPANNQVAVHFVNRSGVDQNTGYIVDTNSNQNNIDYRLPMGYQLANPNEKYSTSSSTNNYYVFDKATQHDIDNGTKFVSTLNKKLQNEVQMSIGWVTYSDENAPDNIKYQKARLKANYSIYGVPRSQVPEIVQSQSNTGSLSYVTTWDVKNSTQFASKMGLSYDQLKSIVYAATNGGSQWMRLNAILANTTREVTETHTQFSDQNAYKIEGNNVYVMVTQPVPVNDASQTRKTAERIISVNLPNVQGVRDRYKGILNSNNQIVQTITFTRTMTKDNLTGTVLSQSAWQGPSSFPAVTLPDIPGYTMTMN